VSVESHRHFSAFETEAAKLPSFAKEIFDGCLCIHGWCLLPFCDGLFFFRATSFILRHIGGKKSRHPDLLVVAPSSCKDTTMHIQ
jgi:hypothetical protein